MVQSTLHVQSWKGKVKKKCISTPGLLEACQKCSPLFFWKRNTPTSVPVYSKSQSPCLLWTVPSAFSHQPSEITPNCVKHSGIWTTGDYIFCIVFSHPLVYLYNPLVLYEYWNVHTAHSKCRPRLSCECLAHLEFHWAWCVLSYGSIEQPHLIRSKGLHSDSLTV